MGIDLRETFPLDHEHAVRALLNAKWDAEENRQLDKRELATLHHGFGTALRNFWQLHERTSPLSRYYQRRYGLSHADDTSALIIEDFLARRKGEKFDINASVRRKKKHWLDIGIDPLTLEKVKNSE